MEFGGCPRKTQRPERAKSELPESELPGFGNSGAPAGAMMEFGGCPRRKRSKRSATGSDLLASICSRTPLPIPTSGSFGHIPSKSGQRNLLLGLKFIF